MRVLIFIWYLLVLLLDLGNDFNSKSPQHIAQIYSNPLIEQSGFPISFNFAEILSLVENEYPDLIREDNTEENEDDRGKDFSPKSGLINGWLLNLPDPYLFSCRLISSLPGDDHCCPIYLRNRVLRI